MTGIKTQPSGSGGLCRAAWDGLLPGYSSGMALLILNICGSPNKVI
jgi:hypothetical protein